MIRAVVLAMLGLWSATAAAVSVREETHQGFTRLVVALPDEAAWTIQQAAQDWALVFTGIAADKPLDIAPLTGGRMRDVRLAREEGDRVRLALKLTCPCSVAVTPSRNLLAIDVADPGRRSTAFFSVSGVTIPRPRPARDAAPVQELTDAGEPEKEGKTGKEPAPLSDRERESRLRLALSRQISEAVQAGLLDPAPDLAPDTLAPDVLGPVADGETGNSQAHDNIGPVLRYMPDAGNKPPQGQPRTGDGVRGPTGAEDRKAEKSHSSKGSEEAPPVASVRASADTGTLTEGEEKLESVSGPDVSVSRPATAKVAAPCVAEPAWPPFDLDGFPGALRETRMGLVVEFDQADAAAIEGLVKLYLVHGFFEEADALLDSLPAISRSPALIRLLGLATGAPAQPVDGHCRGFAAWLEAAELAVADQAEASLAAYARSESSTGAEGFVRMVLAVPVLDAALEQGRGEIAAELMTIAWVEGEDNGTPAAIRRARLARLSGDVAAEREALETIVSRPGMGRDRALLRLAELDIAESRPANIAELAEILLQAPRHPRALLLMAQARGSEDDWGRALVHAGLAPLLGVVGRVLAEPGGPRRALLSAALAAGLPESLSHRPRLRRRIGEALLTVGLDEQAVRYDILPESPPAAPVPVAHGADPDPLRRAQHVAEEVSRFLENDPNG